MRLSHLTVEEAALNGILYPGFDENGGNIL
jgi:hypothetical protein